ncbi:ABC transporter substrate-binding protein [Jutongia hominis]|uniref:ABC transporter substrate-binding protein n=1 Tax=Jutongia hominis TaxID=2763664 RepID=A0ABR7MU08_9FIRM|nr:ABC transporter substrate-binding protein [Jutongia hominis]MBC8557218.1 ABC transporter substrate-binding protein [Jutongia hominis]MEE0289440.1 ABC transporter substrate-binding protein [Lachnospiraceae bacterium]
MKRKLVLLTAMMMAAICLFGCGKSSDGAKNSKKTYKVGIVQYVDDASLNQIQKAVQTELDTQGKKLNVKFDYKDYTFNGQADQSTLNQIMADLVADQVDIIVPIATPTAVVAQSATEDNQIPVVFSAVSDPVTAGLVKSMDKPGSNITGVSDALNTDAFMKMITTAKTVKKIGFLYDKSQDSSTKAIKDAKAYCKKNGIEVVEKTGTTNDEISLAADALIAAKVNAVFTPTDNTVMLAELAIYEKFIKAKIPHYGGADSFALNGAFCGYGVNYEELGTQTGKMVVDILVNGKKPADMAVASLANGIATVNTETASAIGLDYSSFKDLCEQVKETKTAEEFDQ